MALATYERIGARWWRDRLEAWHPPPVGTHRQVPKLRPKGANTAANSRSDKHSEKPEEVRRRIERFYVGPRLSCLAAFRATVSGRRGAAQQGDEVAPSEP